MSDSGQIRALEAELALSRRLLDDAQQLARIGSWEWDLASDVVTWSDELYRIYGFEPGTIELSYENFLGRVHPDDRASVDERNRRCFEDHAPFEDVKRFVGPDGSEFLMRTRGEMVVGEDGVPLRMIGVCEDVTDEAGRRDAEIALAASEMSRRRAMELNDTVIQSLVLARYHFATDVEEARRALNRAIAQCQHIVDELLGPGDGSVQPGALRRSEPASPH